MKLFLGLIGAILVPVVGGIAFLAFNVYTPITPDNVEGRLSLLCGVANVMLSNPQPVECSCAIEVMVEHHGVNELADLTEEIRAVLLVPRIFEVMRGERKAPGTPEELRVMQRLDQHTRRHDRTIQQRCRAGQTASRSDRNG